MVYDLVPGNEYEFRILALNECGRGVENVTKDFAKIEKEELCQRSRKFTPAITDVAPKFTSGLNARMMVVNYEATLSCSLQAHPYPTVKWLYNRVEIDPKNPKYRAIRTNNICQLVLRRARFGDGGTYTCVAQNELGTDQVTTEVIVRDPEEKAKLTQLREIVPAN